MSIYDMVAGKVGGQSNLRRIFLVILGLSALTIVTAPINFQSGILSLVNKPLPIVSSFTFGTLIMIINSMAIIGFWRKDI